jgi:CubicO group peptidase (beta-lactamase class C family)
LISAKPIVTKKMVKLNKMTAKHKANLNHLAEFVTEVMAEKRIPGVAVGILHEGEMATAGFGVTNVNHPLPVTDETLFQIGSITKTYTATAIMQLVEMGKLDLEATVRTYLPDFKVADEAAASQATLRHLLTHTGGWVGDFFHDTGPGDGALARYVADMAGLEQLAPPGTVWSYSNSGYKLAGHIIEKVTGQSFEAALQALVLTPLGLGNSFLDPGQVMPHRFAVGHRVTAEGTRVAHPWPLPRNAYPDGGIICHVKDLLGYARFHLGEGRTPDDTRLLKSESMALMHSPQVAIWGEKEAMGLAWFIEAVNGTPQLWSSGVTNGQNALLLLVPGQNFAVAILTNADRGWLVTHEVSRRALRQYLGLETPDPIPLETSEAELIPYIGHYSRPFADIELDLRAGKLVAQMRYKVGFAEDAPPPP